MRIAMLTTWFYPFPSGSANRFYEIGRRLSVDHEVHVYTTSMDGPREENLEGIHVHRYGQISSSQSLEKGVAELNLTFSIRTMRRMAHDIRSVRFDIIDCNMTSKILPLISFLASKLWRIPLIETWHEVWYTYNLRYYNLLLAPIAMMAEYVVPRLATYCIAVSNTTSQRLINLLGVQHQRVVVIPNGVNLGEFKESNVNARRMRIIYAGRLESHKRVDMLLRAFRKLQGTFPESQLLVVGDGSQRLELEKLSLDLDVENATFLGAIPRSALLRLIQSSTVLVLPSVLEGQGIVLLEAMAAGTPVIAVLSPGSAVKDVVKHGYNGLLVQPRVEEIERAMAELLLNRTLQSTLRENGLRYVKEHDWDSIAVQVSRFYEHVLRKRPMC